MPPVFVGSVWVTKHHILGLKQQRSTVAMLGVVGGKRDWQDRVLRTGRGGPVPGFSLWLKDAFVLCPLFEDTCFESLQPKVLLLKLPSSPPFNLVTSMKAF